MVPGDVVDQMIGADAVDAADARIGEISQVYLDAESERPTWVSVRLGLLSGDEVMVPLDGAEWDDRALHAAVSRDLAKGAPRMEQDEPLTLRGQERLYTHYGIPSVRLPRAEVDLEVDPEEVCYSVHTEAAATAADPSLDSAERFSRAS